MPERLGYRFSRPALLDQALTHRSRGAEHNERLEFLGDGVLGCAVAQELYERFPGLSEGKLTRMRASLVREESLAELAHEIGLTALVRLGEGEEPRPSILADALEAVFGAIFIDGGYEAARTVVLATFAGRFDALDPDLAAKDPKTELQERLQGAHRRLPTYRVTAVKGAAHRQSFDVECVVDDLTAQGTGSSRQRAEQDAAREMLKKLPA